MAIALVVVFHLIQYIPQSRDLLPEVIVKLAPAGQTGVDLFFVLSGFLITGILAGSVNSPRYFTNFYARRAIRIFPLYYLFLLLFLQVDRTLVSEVPVHEEASHLWMFLYVSDLPPTFFVHSVRFSHLWSLAVEEQFYLVWPLVVYFAAKRGRIFSACLALITLGIFSRILLVSLGASAFYSTLGRVDQFALGALAATAFSDRFAREKIVSLSIATGTAALLLLVAMFSLWSGKGINFVQIFKPTLLAVFYASVVVWLSGAKESSTVARLFTWTPLRLLGKFSYCIYLIHPPLMHLLRYILKSIDASSFVSVCGIVLTLLVTLLVSWLSWEFLERPMLSLKRRFE